MDQSLIQSYLAAEEVLLWSGKPVRKIRLGPHHLPLLFTLLMFAAFFLIPLAGTLGPSPDKQTAATGVSTAQGDTESSAKAAPQNEMNRAQRIVMTLFAFVFSSSFLAAILYFIFLQLGGNSLSSSTCYAVTDQRIVIVTGKSKKVVTSLLICSLVHVQMKQWSDGLGTITFSPRAVWPNSNGFYAATPSLENILDSTTVFQLIAKNRGGIPRHSDSLP